jgi:NADPH2:quinone reductase
VRSPSDEPTAKAAGAHHVVATGPDLIERVRAVVPNGVHHIVEVAFGANIATDLALLMAGGSIATFATDAPNPDIPFWPLVFKNIRVFFLGSDDFPPDAKVAAAHALSAALEAGWSGFEIAERVPLSDIAAAHEYVERHARRGRVVVTL